MAEQRFTTSSSRNRKIAKARSKRRTRRRSGFNFIRMAIVIGVTVAVMAPLYLWVQTSEFGSSPAQFLYLAEIRYGVGEMDQALEFIVKAEGSQPNTEELMAIATLRRRIANTRSMHADLSELHRAGRSAAILQRFETQYLQKDPQRREACRELIKLVETWNKNYHEVCNRHVDKIEYQDLLKKVAALDQSYRAAAILSEPDSAEDVLFAAGRPTRLPLRRYRKAVAILNRWIKDNRGARREPEVVAQRNQYHKDCDKWVADKIVGNRTKVANGQLDRALDEMRIIAAECALPGSVDIARQRLQELEKIAAQGR